MMLEQAWAEVADRSPATVLQQQAIARRYGFEGRLVILAEPDIATGDCKIEWADGGVVLDSGATAAKIAELVDRYMASRHPTETSR